MAYKLSDVCDVRDGTHDSPSYVSEGYPLVTSKNIVNSKLDLSTASYISEEDYNKINERSNVDFGDILMPMIGTIGNPLLVGKYTDFAIKNVALIKFNTDKVVNKYILYFLKSNAFVRYVEGKNKGGTQKFLSLGDIRGMMIPEYSVEKQEEIIGQLDKVFEIIEYRKQQLEQLDLLIKARFVEMFGNPVLNNKGWKQNSLGEIASKIGSGATPKGGKDAYQEKGISLIRSMNVHNGIFEYKELAHISDEHAAKLDNVTVEKDDVLLNITGASVARSCVVPREILPARVNQHVCIIRCKECIIPEFLNKLLIDDNYQDLLWSIAGSGATREAITKQQVENLQVILPAVELQKEFMEFCKQIDKSKFAVQKSLEEAQLLFDSLIQKYFG